MCTGLIAYFIYASNSHFNTKRHSRNKKLFLSSRAFMHARLFFTGDYGYAQSRLPFLLRVEWWVVLRRLETRREVRTDPHSLLSFWSEMKWLDNLSTNLLILVYVTFSRVLLRIYVFERESSLKKILAGMPIYINFKNMHHVGWLDMKTNRHDTNRGSGVPRNFVRGRFNKFSWGQRTERTGICGL
jgi:hypothetical protein